MATQTTTQTKYTNEQIRGAILRAADRIEREPGTYNFWSQGSCGSPCCMWGWIGYELGIREHSNGGIVKTLFGETLRTDHLYNFGAKNKFDHNNPKEVPAILRAYADHLYPRPTLDSAYLAFRAAFTGAMEAA